VIFLVPESSSVVLLQYHIAHCTQLLHIFSSTNGHVRVIEGFLSDIDHVYKYSTSCFVQVTLMIGRRQKISGPGSLMFQALSSNRLSCTAIGELL